MKNIELTEEHKVKLLEMCELLFPEYKFIRIEESANMSAWEYEFNNLCFSKKSESYFDIEINIHWFEFCVTHLFYALYDNWRKEDINCVTDFHLDLHNFKTHPIDYLYKKFKELQKLGYEF